MRTVAIINQKGGVGKTVTAINMGAILARDYHKRVLLIDADSQHNLTDFFGVNDDDNNLSALLLGTGEAYYPLTIRSTDVAGLDILPGDDGLMDLDITALRGGRVNRDAIRDLLDCIAEDDAYDYVLIDCPPAFNAASTAALAACSEAITPIKLDAFSLKGLSNMLRQIQNMHQVNPALHVSGCLITMWTKASAEAEEQLRNFNGKMLPIFRQVIRRSDKVDGMTYSGDALTVYSPHSAAGIDYRKFVSEFVGGGKHE